MANLTVDHTKVGFVPNGKHEDFNGIASATIQAHQPICLNTDGKWALADATTDPDLIYIATKTVSAGEFLLGLRYGLMDLGAALASMAYGASIWLSATAGTLADATPATNEQQTVTISGSPTGGDFTLTYAGQTTAAIAYNATAATVQAALEALSGLAGNVLVTGSAGGPYTVQFVNDLKGTNVAAMTASGAGLTGGTSPAVAIATAAAGVYGRRLGFVVPQWGQADGSIKKLFLVDTRR